MELSDYIRVLRKGWLLIVVFVVLGVGAAAAYSATRSPIYTANSKVFVSTQTGNNANDLLQGQNYSQDRITSYAGLVSTPAVLQPVIVGLHLDMTAGQLSKQISASAPLNTTLLEITATDTDPKRAADLANATAESLGNVVQALETTDADQNVSPVKLSRVQDAVVPLSPSSPNIPLNIALGLLVGLAIGVAVAVLRETLDTRIRTEHDIEAISPAPIVGGITFDPKAPSRPLVVADDPFSNRAEAFRTLRTNLQFLNIGEDAEIITDGEPVGRTRGRSFVMTSSLAQEGKSTTTANLGLALASTSSNILVVDADLRRPKLASYLGLEGAAGLTDVLLGKVELADVVQRWGKSNLYVLPAGRVPPNPSELLGSKRMAKLVEMLEEQFDYVLYDAPPLLPVTDAAVLSKITTGSLVIVAAGRTHKSQLRSAVASIEQVGASVGGIVMTMVPTKGPDAYAYGRYGYGYYGEEQADGRGKKKRSRAEKKAEAARA
ncbi:polysaccharide biosynthesis tyrosine autokinase [Gryllotalpicola protaetiae]|uniref:non-specific protein-tyrosine kinase n=1 Tax=Gryllotalpicola protaetiae TaxID=2419771 RepID=A0A387BQ22_9MICO|nr:polysaccharide biosynthesis tyrosine autokinase [Gryllotalpicola protaetiae]AYG04174.1 polysaccharide biosynthesis tyrosine autokinase [Gryllotalpicola protaetiae]